MNSATELSLFEPLLYAASQRCADMFYFGRFWAPDPFIAFGFCGKKIGVFNALERARAEKTSRFDEILSYEVWAQKAKVAFGKTVASTADIIAVLAQSYQIAGFLVPEDFPISVALNLEALKVRLAVKEAPFFQQRMIKTPEEINCIKEANKITALGIRAAEETLRRSQIAADGTLILDGKLLTSERLRTIIEITCLEAGAVAQCIAAGGAQGCDPHEIGQGPLRAHELIVVDVFPRVKATGYYGDMTRTFLKGTPSDAQVKLVQTVQEAQRQAINRLAPHVRASTVNQAVVDYFDSQNYRTITNQPIPEGFFHSTGHGVGLDLHEPLRISTNSTLMLEPGMVITIEPGLYYPDIGGCRIEDVVCITPDKAALLSSYNSDYSWHLN